MKNRNELYESIQSGRLIEAHYYSKWYGSYHTCITIQQIMDYSNGGDIPTGKFYIRKDDVSTNDLITRTHYLKDDLTKEEVIKVLNRVRDNTYYVVEFDEYLAV